MGIIQRLEAANKVLESMAGKYHRWYLERDGGNRLWFVHEHEGKKTVKGAVLDKNGQSVGFRYENMGMGGTNALYVGQLIRFVKDQPRYATKWMRYWSEAEKTVLIEAGYDDPDMTKCVICGKEITNPDWYSYQGLKGPCCLYVSCKYPERRAS